ncbi:putative monoglyceride lipase, partial [Pseudocercospora fuligena]
LGSQSSFPCEDHTQTSRFLPIPNTSDKTAKMSTVTFANIKTTEGILTTSDGATLYTKTWHPSTPILARLVFLHGFSDHCNFYGVLFPTLASSGIKVYSYDQRGWGRSVTKPSQKGLTGPTSRIMSDITEFIQSLPSEEASTPLFLMGHSMGGGEILYYAATGPQNITSQIRGYLAEAPYIRLHPTAMPWKMTVLAGKILGKILPHAQMVQKLQPEKLSRDPEVCREWESDPLNHDMGTLEGLAAMIDRAAELEEGKVKIRDQDGKKVSVWIGFGSGDQVLDWEACKKWFEKKLEVADKEFRIYDGWYHKLHAEPEEDKFLFAKDVKEWILARSITTNSASEEENLQAATTKPKL